MTEPIELADAAERLGVHYQTAYRWVREGRLPAVRVRGRYQILPDDIDALAAAREAPRPAGPAVGRRDWPRLADRLHTALRDGDERAAADLVGRLHAQREPVLDVVSRVLAPAMVRIGDDWSGGVVSVAEEHRASEIVERLLVGIDQRRPGRPRGTAVVTAPGGELHGLPVSMAAAVLRADGWTVESLGRDLPGDALLDFVSRVGPDLVVLTATLATMVEAAEALSDQLTAAGLDVLVGEPGRSLADLVEGARRVRAEQRRLLGQRIPEEEQADQ